MKIRIKFDQREWWIGIRWKQNQESRFHCSHAKPLSEQVFFYRDIHICVIPCFPINIRTALVEYSPYNCDDTEVEV